jgi:hypothetical protein
MKLTLIVPHGKCGEEVTEGLATIAAHQLITRFMVVHDDFRCIDIDGATRTESDVRATLSGLADFELVRILLLSVDRGAPTPEERCVIETLARKFRDVSVPVLVGSIVVPLHGELISPRAFSTYWNFNVVFVPEDGTGEERSITTELCNPATRLSIAIGAVALIGGLWRWLDTGPLDTLPSTGSGDRTRVRIGRAYTRIIDAGDVAMQTVDWVLQSGTRLPPPPGCVQTGNNEELVARMVDAVAPAHRPSPLGFSYRPLPPDSAPAPRVMGPIDAIKHYVGELLRELWHMTLEAVERRLEELVQRVEKAVQERTFGADSEVVVSLRAAPDVSTRIDGEERRAAVQSLHGIRPSHVSSTPGTWAAFTRFVIAAVDGSDVPNELAGHQPEWNGHRAVVGDTSLLATDGSSDRSGGELQLSPADLETLGLRGSEAITAGPADPLAGHLFRDAMSAKTSGATLVGSPRARGGAEKPRPDKEPGVTEAARTRE